MGNYKNLKIWKIGLEVVKEVYQLTKQFPSTEKFGLSSQCQRSAVSIPSNISEGSSRRGIRDQYRFLEIALGSSFELETQILLAHELNYLQLHQAESFLKKLNELQKMMVGYMSHFDQTKKRKLIVKEKN
jgi:four helix bundle protein